ncbi:hypothetical protein [uncultured Tateyamaria sp.]|nr:hypothetical protein [uncultured Tateyamaria sp.]
MKAMLLAFVAIGVISVGSYFILGEVGFSSQERGAGAAVRLDD